MPRRAAMPGFSASIYQLVIIDASVKMDISVEETRAYAAMTPRFGKDTHRAYYVADNDLIFGALRLYEQERAESSGHISVFKHFEKACTMVGISTDVIFKLWPDIKDRI